MTPVSHPVHSAPVTWTNARAAITAGCQLTAHFPAQISTLLSTLRGSRPGEGVQFGGHGGGLGRTDPLEDLLRLPQAGLRVGGGPAARAQRPRPASAWASSQELPISRARSRACR